VAKKIFITNQRELAEAVNRSQEHLSAWKNRKTKPSEEMIQAIKKITGISSVMLVAGDKRSLAKQLREFFEGQRKSKMINM